MGRQGLVENRDGLGGRRQDLAQNKVSLVADAISHHEAARIEARPHVGRGDEGFEAFEGTGHVSFLPLSALTISAVLAAAGEVALCILVEVGLLAAPS